ncbi:Cyclic nucleotide-binding protein [Flavobacterium sp. 9AF]|uniref:Crp/Fnr family transcriptional regulator n=1 Tax=Flavobacterium sp. 9AF TaxID=2653142 RepID=UPI0012F10ADF|nr:Crp/Fnr family transcriptional regulator [Flavobacterium sp. 9AF]VXC07578.1 Cyclic nucleotide-binding protein [Flavobacterium sp. 9AF]
MEDILKLFFEKFKDLNDEETDAIAAHTELKNFKKGDIILEQGKDCNKCYFILKGCVRKYQVIDAKERTTGFFLEGNPIIFYSSYINKKPSEYYLSCLEDCTVLIGTREQELELHKKYPNIENNLIYSLMLQDYEKVENYNSLLNSYKPEERYLMLMKTQPELFNRIPLLHIASFLGVTPESYSRIRKRIMTKKV